MSNYEIENAIKTLEEQKNEFLEEFVDYGGVAKAYNYAIECIKYREELENKIHELKEIIKYNDGMDYDTKTMNYCIDFIEGNNDDSNCTIDDFLTDDAKDLIRKANLHKVIIGDAVQLVHDTDISQDTLSSILSDIHEAKYCIDRVDAVLKERVEEYDKKHHVE